MNRMKTLVLLSTLTALLVWAGHALGGAAGLLFALLTAAVMNIGVYWFAGRLVLRMHSAQALSPAESPQLHGLVRELARRAGLPMPELHLIPEPAPNAFATGRDPEHGIVAVTEGLLRLLDYREIEGVVAHELGHIKNRDTLIMAVAATLAGALSTLANLAMWGSLFGGHDSSEEEGSGSPWGGLAGIMLAPLAATLVQMSISRTREFLADEAAARLTGAPLALASALRKIEERSREVPMHSGSAATAHLFIHNPLSLAGLATLFSTHPPVEERVSRLQALAHARKPVAA